MGRLGFDANMTHGDLLNKLEEYHEHLGKVLETVDRQEADLAAAYAAIRDADAGMVAVNGDTKRWRKKHAGAVEKARKEAQDG